MAFNAKLAIAIVCFLTIFLGTVLSKERNLTSYRRSIPDPVEVSHHRRSFKGGVLNDFAQGYRKENESKSAVHKEPDEDELSPRNLAPRPGWVTNFMAVNIPIVRNQIQLPGGIGQYAAVWIDTLGPAAGFVYVPAGPVQNPGFFCAPPPPPPSENHLVAKLYAPGPPPWIHSEEILEDEVQYHNGLRPYATGRQITRILMYSYHHPCEACAHRMVRICNWIKNAMTTVVGVNNNLDCHMVFSVSYATRAHMHGERWTDVQTRANVLAGSSVRIYQMIEPVG